MEKTEIRAIILKQAGLARQRLATKRMVERHLSLDHEMSHSEISIISGVRRSGKSTYLGLLKNKYAEGRATIAIEFDDPALEGFAANNFSHVMELFTEFFPGKRLRLLLLDEIQNITGWEKWLPQLAKDPDLKIVVTGSTAALLSSELGTLLTGRHRAHELTPLSFGEILGCDYPGIPISDITPAQRLASYDRYFTYGGFPRSLVESDASILPQYFSDILERDVIARHGARLTRPLRELALVLCSDNTKMLNRTKLAKQLGIRDDATVRRYCQWLQDCFLFREIKGFSPSVRKQLRSHPKFYCIDPTLARSSAFSLFEGEGAFLENSVHNELTRRGYELHYWKAEAADYEVDFIARKPGHPTLGIQTSLTVIDEQTLLREVRGLACLKRELNIENLLLITKQDQQRQIEYEGASILSIPFLEWACEA